MANAKPNELYTKRDKLKEIISSTKIELRETNIEIGKKEGKVVDSIADLICKKHPNAGFDIIGIIPGSEYWKYILEEKFKNGLNIYGCKECLPFVKTEAYDCPYCGIVVSKFREDKYTHHGEEGKNYYCINCDEKIGKIRLKT